MQKDVALQIDLAGQNECMEFLRAYSPYAQGSSFRFVATSSASGTGNNIYDHFAVRVRFPAYKPQRLPLLSEEQALNLSQAYLVTAFATLKIYNTSPITDKKESRGYPVVAFPLSSPLFSSPPTSQIFRVATAITSTTTYYDLIKPYAQPFPLNVAQSLENTSKAH